MYITREDMLEVLGRMQDLETKLGNLFANHYYDLRENLGRRNQLLSCVQEKETARVLRKRYASVIDDGAPGKPDVVIQDIGKELECKLTSGSKSGGSVSFSLQTDYATLENKGSLDYLFILANDNFNEFCVIFFEGLTIDDYFPPASGSRGKARMKKQSAMKKATFLVGGVKNLADDHLEKINRELDERQQELEYRLIGLRAKLNGTSLNAKTAREQISNVITNEASRYDSAIAKLISRKKYWTENPKYSFQFEKVSQITNEYKRQTMFQKLKGWCHYFFITKLGGFSWLTI
tara:strand:- start:323 stop:1198 length:876 start_codon:yes stop_codon:yes gene_type:complete